MGTDDLVGPAIAGADLTQANVARMYDYFLGGSHNFAVDRELAEQVVEVSPDTVPAVRELRSFTRRAVTACVERGIDQFLDLGSGIPSIGTVHEVARRRVPGARVAYVDHGPLAVHHSRELLRDVEGVSITHADLRDPASVLAAPTVTEVIDLDRPVGLLMLAVLHFLPEAPAAVVGAYREVLVPGSAVAVSHVSDDWDDPALVDAMRARVEVYRRSTHPARLRGRAEVEAVFAGLELAAPGLVDITRWRPDTTPLGDAGVYGGLGFVPDRTEGVT